jgi:hypothetical protein
LDQESGNSTERIAITLLVCYLFTCFDHLAGNYVQAVKHLRGGVELSRNIDKAILTTTVLMTTPNPQGFARLSTRSQDRSAVSTCRLYLFWSTGLQSTSKRHSCPSFHLMVPFRLST